MAKELEVVNPTAAGREVSVISEEAKNLVDQATSLITVVNGLRNRYHQIMQYQGAEIEGKRGKVGVFNYRLQGQFVKIKETENVKKLDAISSDYENWFGNVSCYNKILQQINNAVGEVNNTISEIEENISIMEDACDDPADNYVESSDSAGSSSSSWGSDSGESSDSGGGSNSYGYTSLGTVGQVASNFIAKPFEDSSTGENSAIDKVKQTATDSISNTFKDSSTEKKSSVEKNVDNIISIDNTSDSSSSTSSDASIQTAEETQKQVTDTIVTPVDTATGSEYEAIPKTGLEGKKSSNVQLIPIAVGAALGAAGVTAKKLQKKDSKDDEKDNKDKD